jgi:hypothetical protein
MTKTRQKTVVLRSFQGHFWIIYEKRTDQSPLSTTFHKRGEGRRVAVSIFLGHYRIYLPLPLGGVVYGCLDLRA